LFLTNDITMLFISFGISGVGLGIAAPGKLVLFSTHLDKNRESLEWGIHDAMVFFCMSLAAAAGGLIAANYGFKTLFILSTIINLLAIIPYLLFVYKPNTIKA
jgi:MFS family permease